MLFFIHELCSLLFNLKIIVLQSKVQCIAFINIGHRFISVLFRLSRTHMLQVCLIAQLVECGTDSTVVKCRSDLTFNAFFSYCLSSIHVRSPECFNLQFNIIIMTCKLFYCRFRKNVWCILMASHLWVKNVGLFFLSGIFMPLLMLHSSPCSEQNTNKQLS